jgi:hypothetical protein
MAKNPVQFRFLIPAETGSPQDNKSKSPCWREVAALRFESLTGFSSSLSPILPGGVAGGFPTLFLREFLEIRLTG